MIDSKRLTRWYDFQAPVYHFWRDNYESSLVAVVAKLLTDNESPKEVLDVGCGSGLLAVGLGIKHPNWRITGVDPSIGMLTIARKAAIKRGLGNLVFTEGIVARLEFPDARFDVIVASGLFPNINDHAGALAEMKRVLKPGGTMAVIEFDRTSMGTLSRAFFNCMIIGYRMISGVFRRFRFAVDWDIEKSTIDRSVFLDTLTNSGFAVSALRSAGDHMVFVLRNAGT
ncbi:MAG: methyltransferase domain-containing protein [bacterium]